MSTKVKSISQFRSLLNQRLSGATWHVKRGIQSKNLVLDFFEENGRWPTRLSRVKAERSLAARFENYVSKEAASYDPQFRQLAFSMGRTTNSKRKHNVRGFKKQILNFIEEHGHAPSPCSSISGERNLAIKLGFYTREKGDMTFLGKVYGLDPCHRSGIKMKFRKIINEGLDVEKPLIRLVRK